MVHLYGCTIFKKKIPVDDNRIHCSDCGSEICGSCYLSEKTSPFHNSSHANYMIADFSGSMYVRPPAPPMRAAQKANGTPNKEKSAAEPQTSAGLKRKHLDDDYANRPAAAPQKISGLKRERPDGASTVCARCRERHRRCSGPTDDGWCQLCQETNYIRCDFSKAAQNDTSDKEISGGFPTSWSRSSAVPELTKSTLSLGGPSNNASTSEDRESSSSKPPQPRRQLFCRLDMPSYVFDEWAITRGDNTLIRPTDDVNNERIYSRPIATITTV